MSMALMRMGEGEGEVVMIEGGIEGGIEGDGQKAKDRLRAVPCRAALSRSDGVYLLQWGRKPKA